MRFLDGRSVVMLGEETTSAPQHHDVCCVWMVDGGLAWEAGAEAGRPDGGAVRRGGKGLPPQNARVWVLGSRP